MLWLGVCLCNSYTVLAALQRVSFVLIAVVPNTHLAASLQVPAAAETFGLNSDVVFKDETMQRQIVHDVNSGSQCETIAAPRSAKNRDVHVIVNSTSHGNFCH